MNELFYGLLSRDRTSFFMSTKKILEMPSLGTKGRTSKLKRLQSLHKISLVQHTHTVETRATTRRTSHRPLASGEGGTKNSREIAFLRLVRNPQKI